LITFSTGASGSSFKIASTTFCEGAAAKPSIVNADTASSCTSALAGCSNRPAEAPPPADRVTGHLNANRMPLRQHEDIIVFYDRQPVYHPQMMPCPPERKNHGRRKTDGFTNRCYGEMKLAPVRVAEDKYPTSVISIPKEHKTGAFYHPTQKPVALIEYLMRTYTNEGDVVLDNCIGSGTTAIAAIRTGRHYIGFEIEPTYCEIAGRRIREELERGHGIKESEIREIKK